MEVSGFHMEAGIAKQSSTHLLEDIEPHVLGPMRRNGREQKSLKLNIASTKIRVHTQSSRLGSFTVEIASTGEVVESRLESRLVIRPAQVVSIDAER
jgi:hypothetical protein